MRSTSSRERHFPSSRILRRTPGRGRSGQQGVYLSFSLQFSRSALGGSQIAPSALVCVPAPAVGTNIGTCFLAATRTWPAVARQVTRAPAPPSSSPSSQLQLHHGTLGRCAETRGLFRDNGVRLWKLTACRRFTRERGHVRIGIGSRIHTDLVLGSPVDLGTAFVHGSLCSPLMEVSLWDRVNRYTSEGWRSISADGCVVCAGTLPHK